MNTNDKNLMKNGRLFALLFGAAIILSIPLIAMQFSSEVNWGLSDFLIMGALLFGTALIIEFILRNAKSLVQRVIFCAIILIVLFLVWAELAVGVFGTPFAGS